MNSPPHRSSSVIVTPETAPVPAVVTTQDKRWKFEKTEA